MPAKAGIQILTGSPLKFIPDLIGDGDERQCSYAASARAPFSAGVIAPEPLISATSPAE
jgi:hypothetical protein